MDRKNVSSVNNLPCGTVFRQFFKQDRDIISKMNSAITEDNHQEVKTNGVCFYNYFLCEDNVQVSSQDGLISFYSVFDNLGQPKYAFGSFQNPKTEEAGSFLLERGSAKVSSIAKYFISTPLNKRTTQITRGIEIFEKNQVSVLESQLVINSWGRVLSAKADFVRQTDDHIREEEIFSDNTRELKDFNQDLQMDFIAFRSELLATDSSTHSCTIDGRPATLAENMQTRFMVKDYEFNPDYQSIVEEQALQEQ